MERQIFIKQPVNNGNPAYLSNRKSRERYYEYDGLKSTVTGILLDRFYCNELNNCKSMNDIVAVTQRKTILIASAPHDTTFALVLSLSNQSFNPPLKKSPSQQGSIPDDVYTSKLVAVGIVDGKSAQRGTHFEKRTCPMSYCSRS